MVAGFVQCLIPVSSTERQPCRHHAQKSYASGFCYVADCILAIMALKRSPPIASPLVVCQRKPRIMYLDLDLHFSDAVSEAFSFQNQPGMPQILVSHECLLPVVDPHLCQSEDAEHPPHSSRFLSSVPLLSSPRHIQLHL
jgi:hypothetical protein